MKKSLFLLVWVVCFLVGCDQTQEVTIDSPTLEVSPQVVRPGEAVTLTLLPGENTNVDFRVVFYWEGEEIGRANGYPYQLDYVVPESCEPGFYTLSADASFSESSATGSSSGNISVSTFVTVEE